MSELLSSILITGGRGLLAKGLGRACSDRGLAVSLASRDECDICVEEDLHRAFAAHRPSLVFNCAGFTEVDLCEVESKAADRVNGHAVNSLARVCREHDAFLVHFSTDFVFDGDRAAHRPYRPVDPANPLSAYGRSKLLGERLLAEHGAAGRWLIIRTAWLFGIDGGCFPRTVLNLARAGRTLHVVNDQLGSPTFVGDLAEAALDLLADKPATSVVHAANRGQASWYELAQATLDEFQIDADLIPVTTAEWRLTRPGQAMRPAYSVLDLDNLEQRILRPMRDWREALRAFHSQVEPAFGRIGGGLVGEDYARS